MQSVTLFSQIASGGSINPTTDRLLAVRSGADDVLVQINASAEYTANQTLSGANSIVLANSISGAVNFELPLAADNDGLELVIKKISSDVNNVGILAQGEDMIDGATAIYFNLQWTSYTLIANAANNLWLIV